MSAPANAITRQQLLRQQALQIPEISVTRNGVKVEGLTDKVIALAHACGWLVYHQRPARTGRGWRTAIQGDAGFPDLVLARDQVTIDPNYRGRLIVAELKTEQGKLTQAQLEWIQALGLTHSIETYVWRPSDLLSGAIEEVLR